MKKLTCILLAIIATAILLCGCQNKEQKDANIEITDTSKKTPIETSEATANLSESNDVSEANSDASSSNSNTFESNFEGIKEIMDL